MSDEIETKDPMNDIPYYVFWREGCAKFVSTSCRLLRLAGEPVTRESITHFIVTAPRMEKDLSEFFQVFRTTYCGYVLEKGRKKCQPESPEHKSWSDACSYIVAYFPSRRWDTQEMLIETLIGAMAGLDLDPPPAPTEEPKPRKRFFLFRR